MIKNPRKAIVDIVLRPNSGPSAHIWPNCATYVLECGHQVNVGVVEVRGYSEVPEEELQANSPAQIDAIRRLTKKTRCACSECGTAARVAKNKLAGVS